MRSGESVPIATSTREQRGDMTVKLNPATLGGMNAHRAVNRPRRGGLARACAAAFLALTMLAGSAIFALGQAQFPAPKKDKERNAPKNLTGQVVNKDGSGIPDAIVYLKDKKTLEMKTHISDEKGAYRFTGLDPNGDYEVYAESKGAASSKRTVSSFDDRKEVYLVLELGAVK